MQTLDEVVREYMIELGEVSEHKYARLLQLGFQAVRELNMDVSGVLTSVKLSVSSADIVNLPNDYIDYVGIYVCRSGDGVLLPLGWNDNICLPRTYDKCGDIDRSSVDETQSVSQGTVRVWGTETGGSFRNGEIVGRIYGIGGGNNINGYYRIDEKNHTIVLDNPVSRTIVLEYLADPQRVDGNYQVHSYDIEAVKAYIYWKDIQRNRTFGIGDKEAARQEWRRSYRIAKKRHNNFTLQEAVQIGRKSNKQSPKF